MSPICLNPSTLYNKHLIALCYSRINNNIFLSKFLIISVIIISKYFLIKNLRCIWTFLHNNIIVDNAWNDNFGHQEGTKQPFTMYF